MSGRAIWGKLILQFKEDSKKTGLHEKVILKKNLSGTRYLHSVTVTFMFFKYK